jgi:hypothetical protein
VKEVVGEKGEDLSIPGAAKKSVKYEPKTYDPGSESGKKKTLLGTKKKDKQSTVEQVLDPARMFT